LLDRKIAEMPFAPCPKRQVLEDRFRTEMKLYVEAIQPLACYRVQDFDKIYEASESARLAFVGALDALIAHIVAHHCEV
jgi:hypothetical protein